MTDHVMQELNFEHENFVAHLRELGATDSQAQELARDPERARAAIARGAGKANPMATALVLFRSATFLQPMRGTALSGRLDPRRDDEGDRIWQADEVDEAWRRGYLADCVAALREGREPAARYAPSDAEWDALAAIARAQAPVTGPVTLAGAARALAGWAEVWGLDTPAGLDELLSVADADNDDLSFEAA